MAISLRKESGTLLVTVALKLRDDEYIIIDRKKDRSHVQVREKQRVLWVRRQGHSYLWEAFMVVWMINIPIALGA